MHDRQRRRYDKVLLMKTAVLTPAYGREYKSGVDVLRDYRDNKDFLLNDPKSRWYMKPINREQLLDSKYTDVQIRYNHHRNLIHGRIEEMTDEDDD